MELQQLKYFQTVARLQHFTRAAEELYISQPSLSRSIARLEEELGAPLFDREGRQVRLNRLGQTFLKRVERVFNELEVGQRELQDLIGPEKGLVAVAFLHTVGVRLLPLLLSAFRAEHPNISFRLFQNSAGVMLNQLEEGEIDLCISSPLYDKPGLGWAHLMTEEIFLAVPAGHRLAHRKSVKLWEAADEYFISLKPGYALRNIADGLCRQSGFEPKVAFEGEEITTARGLVAAGLGVSLVPGLAWQGVTDPLPVRLHIEEPVAQRTISLAWVENRYLSAAARLFRDFVIEHFAELERKI
jgi:DNA-binding transcriptional LysR family regulator